MLFFDQNVGHHATDVPRAAGDEDSHPKSLDDPCYHAHCAAAIVMPIRQEVVSGSSRIGKEKRWMKASRGCGEEACSFTSRPPSSTRSNTKARKASQSEACRPENPHMPFERFLLAALNFPWALQLPGEPGGFPSDLRARLAAIDRHG
jgi:hypothetical protein